ncbi:MAG: hypothetical protein AB7O45_05010, partial [Alphaproteobacteria bacterium]
MTGAATARRSPAGLHGIALAIAAAVALAFLAAAAALLHWGSLAPERAGRVVALFPPGTDG